MKWNEFLTKLKQAREIKKDNKISVAVLCNLIFNGTFDSMIEEKDPTVETYKRMFEEVKKIKNSKANLPKKRKGEFIGLDQVKSKTQLAVWRSQSCPIVKKIEFEPEIENTLKNYGYERVKKADSIFTFVRGPDIQNKKQSVYATAKWSEIFKDSRRIQLFDNNLLMVYGIISDVSLRRYGANKEKEMLSFKVFTGEETTDELVVWPKKTTNEVSEVMKSEIKNGNLGGVLIRPSFYKGRPAGTVMSFMRFFTDNQESGSIHETKDTANAEEERQKKQ